MDGWMDGRLDGNMYEGMDTNRLSIQSLCSVCSGFPPISYSVDNSTGTTRAHAYNIRKWRPSQRTAATECCEWLLLTRVNLKL